MRTIEQTYTINAAPGRVFKALTDPEDIAAWSGGEASMDAKPGGAFVIWGGSILGTNLEVVPDKKLVQTWREDTWDVDSRVAFTLTPDGNGTRVDLTHEDVPDAEYDDIAEGWNIYLEGGQG
ncbi:MAG: SRPBCC domain-containing protein [bacterium]|nr:SRPBCC domain-containing protein [bacterium]